MELICQHCEKPFQTRQKKRKYCSRACFGLSNRGKNNPAWNQDKLPELVCKYCKKSFKPRYVHLKRIFCSKACKNNFLKSQIGTLHPNFKGGCIRPDGYRAIYIEGRVVLEHRHFMEVHLGRPLSKTEYVHHKDGDRLNNQIENLMLLQSLAQHNLLHATYRSDTHKECSKCHVIKVREDFSPSHFPKRDKNASWCKSCYADNARGT